MNDLLTRISAYWYDLSSREQVLLGSAVGLTAFALLFLGILQPIANYSNSVGTRVETAEHVKPLAVDAAAGTAGRDAAIQRRAVLGRTARAVGGQRGDVGRRRRRRRRPLLDLRADPRRLVAAVREAPEPEVVDETALLGVRRE